MHRLILTFSCDDQPGIVNAVTGAIVTCGGNITELQQYSSIDTNRFFMRIEVDVPATTEDFRVVVGQVATRMGAKKYDMQWQLHFSSEVPRQAIFVSRQPHCLYDLLARWKSGELEVVIPLIISNHEDLRPVAEQFGVDFHHFPICGDTKGEQEEAQLELLARHRVEFIVLARYMQILSPMFISRYRNRIINIHHSFLPGFKGANPYRQAHGRGVKLIGATAHFVTSDLDEGPIIEQNVERVDHTHTVAELTTVGQGLESVTLTSAVRLFAEKRIFLDGVRTVIFK